MLSKVKPFVKTGFQGGGGVIKIKEGNAGMVLSSNSYHLMQQSSEKGFKIAREVANAPGLAFVYR
jgi:hypothetical protein